MKTSWMRLSALLGLLLLGSAAHAVVLPFEDQNGNRPDNSPVFLNSLFNPTHTWTFNLDSDALEVGDVDPGDDILTAALAIDIEDDRFDPIVIELGSLGLDNSLIWAGEVDEGVHTLNVLSWVSDHVLNVQICAVLGDFWVNSVTLSGTYDNGVVAPPDEPVVPEPATLSLLGLGLTGLGVLRRRRRA